MLQNVSLEAACGSVSFSRLRGKAGMGDSEHILSTASKLKPISPVCNCMATR